MRQGTEIQAREEYPETYCTASVPFSQNLLTSQGEPYKEDDRIRQTKPSNRGRASMGPLRADKCPLHAEVMWYLPPNHKSLPKRTRDVVEIS